MAKKQNPVQLGIFSLLISLCCIGSGLWTFKDHNTKLKNCTEQVTAVVTENIVTKSKKRVGTGNSSTKRRHYRKVKNYTPVFKFEYDGKDYSVKGRKTEYSSTFYVGEKVELKINPSDPSEYYQVNDNSYSHSGKVFMIMGMGLLIFGIFMIIKFK